MESEKKTFNVKMRHMYTTTYTVKAVDSEDAKKYVEGCHIDLFADSVDDESDWVESVEEAVPIGTPLNAVKWR